MNSVHNVPLLTWNKKQHRQQLNLNLLYYQFITLMNLSKANKKLTEELLLNIEKQKLAIILLILQSLNDNAIAKNKEIELTTAKQTISFKTLFGYIYAFVGPFFAGITGFIGFRTILSLIMHIPTPPALVLALITGIFEGVLAFGKEENNVKKLIGSPIIKPKPIIVIYKEQLASVIALSNTLLSHSTCDIISRSNYIRYQKIMDLFHQDIIDKNQQLKKQYQQGLGRRLLKWTVSGIDALLCIGSAYLLGKILLGLLAAPLLLTPVGYGICAGIAIFAVATFYYVKKEQISEVIDNLVGDPKKLKADQEKFIHHPQGITKFNKEIKSIIDSKNKKAHCYQYASILSHDYKKRHPRNETYIRHVHTCHYEFDSHNKSHFFATKLKITPPTITFKINLIKGVS